MGNFFKRFGSMVVDLFTSKKFVTAAVGVGVAIASGTPVGPAILAGAGAYVLGQGVADHGKEAAKVNLEAAGIAAAKAAAGAAVASIQGKQMLPDSKYFKVAEFRCHDGTDYPEDWVTQWSELSALCDAVRDLAGVPCDVVSGYRTADYNANLILTGHHDVASSSNHILGLAADLRPQPSFGQDDVLVLHDKVLDAYNQGNLPTLGGLGLYPSWIHIDLVKAEDGHLRRWNTRKAQNHHIISFPTVGKG